MKTMRAKLGSGGRLVLPAAYRRSVGLRPGDEVVVLDDGDSLTIFPARLAIKRAQQMVARHIPAGSGLVDSLISDRRREARREAGLPTRRRQSRKV